MISIGVAAALVTVAYLAGLCNRRILDRAAARSASSALPARESRGVERGASRSTRPAARAAGAVAGPTSPPGTRVPQRRTTRSPVEERRELDPFWSRICSICGGPKEPHWKVCNGPDCGPAMRAAALRGTRA